MFGLVGQSERRAARVSPPRGRGKREDASRPGRVGFAPPARRSSARLTISAVPHSSVVARHRAWLSSARLAMQKVDGSGPVHPLFESPVAGLLSYLVAIGGRLSPRGLVSDEVARVVLDPPAGQAHILLRRRQAPPLDWCAFLVLFASTRAETDTPGSTLVEVLPVGFETGWTSGASMN